MLLSIYHKKSLSLIEVMVGVVVFALLSLALYTLLHTGINVRKKIVNQQEYVQNIYLRLELIAREVRNIVIFKKNDPDTPALKGDIGGFSFFTLLFDYEHNKPVIRNIKYEFSAGNLIKTISEPLSGQLQKEFIFIEKVIDIAFYYFDESKPEKKEWQESFDYSIDPMNIPKGIKIEIKFLDKSDKEQVIRKYIFLSQSPKR